jgi:hypothetical protein
MRNLVVVAGIALASCSAGEVRGPTYNPGFARELAGRVAGPPQTCISTFGDQNVRPIDSRTIAYGSGRTIYVSQLRSDCPSLSPHNSLIIERTGSQLCRGDRIRAFEPGAIIPGPICIVQDWVPHRTR